MSKTIIAGLVATLAIGAGFGLGISLSGADQAAPTVTTMLGFIGVVITQLLGNKTSEDTRNDLRNGRVEHAVRSALEKIAQEENSPLIIRRQEDSDGRQTL